ncbi:hypothetical protein HOG48_04415 [Candidatus Peregrinibacteria bacterium]|jgi:hypothetical protein|nr:hypothetical protein [Candidatus Peregrinibacteria bacterium]
MKNIFKKFTGFTTTLGLLLMPKVVYAKVYLEDVFRKYRINGRSEFNELNNTADLPDPDIVDLIIQIIDIVLRVSSILIFLSLTISGILFVVSRGEGDANLMEKAKKILIYSVVGTIVIMSAYAIVYGVTSIKYNF